MSYEILNYTLKREEHLWRTWSHAKNALNEPRHRMVWVLRKDDRIMHISQTKEDMILEMMVGYADAMDVV